jgi:hypothetical protein
LYGCELLFDQVGAERVRRSIMAGLGTKVCPCMAGQPCPLLPPSLTPLLLTPAQTVRTIQTGQTVQTSRPGESESGAA